jgi:diacylglycerol kinase family enzyme
MSYFYVYDEFVQERRYERELIKIEHRLTDIGIQGKIGRVALFRHIGEIVRDEAKRGAQTIVVVGDDETFRKLMPVLPELEVVVGLIPLGAKTRIAEVLGVPAGAEACDTLSARIIETLDVGRLNERYFFSSVEAFGSDVAVQVGGKYQIKAAASGGIEVRNVGSLAYADLRDGLANARDGMLEVVIHAELPKERLWSRPKTTHSIFPMKQLGIVGATPISVMLDGVLEQFSKIELSCLPKALKIISGKARLIV